MTVASLYRTLDQELVAIMRGASLECPVCGEFLLHRADGIGCPECGLEIRGESASLQGLAADDSAEVSLPSPVQAG